MVAREGSDPKKTTRYNLPTDKVPLLSELDDEVNWTTVGIEVRAFLMRWKGYEDVILNLKKVVCT